MYVRTSFRGSKTCKIGKKGYVFGHIDKFWKGHDAQIKKTACKNAYLGSIFIPEKYVSWAIYSNLIIKLTYHLQYDYKLA